MSFAQEVRDFLAGYQAVTGVTSRNRELDMREASAQQDQEYRTAMLELQRERLDLDRQRLARGGGGGDSLARERLDLQRRAQELRERSYADTRADARGTRLEALAGSVYGEVTGGGNLGPGLSNLGRTPESPTGDWSAFGSPPPPPPVDEGDEDWSAFNRGGLVPGPTEEELGGRALPIPTPAYTAPAPLSQGAAVAAGSPAMPPQAAIPGAAPAPANPTPAAPGATLAAGGFPEPAPDGPPEATQIVLRRAGEAADAALRRFSVPRTAVGEGSEEPVDPVTGEGAVTPQVYEQLVRRVDPDGRLAPHMRNAALLAEGYSFFRERGQPGDQQRAAVFAQRIVMAQRQMAQTLGALSLEALEGGDTAAACRLLGDACNMFPSGHQVQVQPSGQNGAIYRVVRDGEVVTSGSLDSSQLWGMAGEVANGRLFLREVMDFAANNRVPPPDPPSHAHYQPVNSAYVAFRRARETYENMLDSEADPTEMRAAQARMREAEQKYNEALVAAQDAGVSRADLEARSARALQDAPTDRDPPPGERRDTADTPRMTNDEHFDRLAQVVRGYQATTAEYERLSALPPGHRDRPDDVELARLHGELLGQHRQIEAFSREARDAGVSEADLRRHIADTRSSPLPERAGSNAQGRLERAARAYQAYQEAVLAVPTRGTPGQDQAAEVQRLRREYEDAVASAVSYGDSRQTVVAQAAAITERRMLDPAVEPVPSAPAGPPGRPVLVMGPGLRPEAPRGQPPAAIPYPQPRPQR